MSTIFESAQQIIDEANECIANNERFIARSKWWDFSGRAAARRGIDYNAGRLNVAMNIYMGESVREVRKLAGTDV